MGPDYGNWDGDHVTVCYCDWGFFGPDCSLKICAKDDDPTTSNQKYRTISIRLSGGGSGLSGVVRISFLGFSTELSANYGAETDVKNNHFKTSPSFHYFPRVDLFLSFFENAFFVFFSFFHHMDTT